MGYTSEKSWELYDNSGTTEDWSYGVTGAYGYTIESSDQNFHEAYEKAVVGEYLRIGGGGNREAFLRALEAAADPASHAVIEGFAPPGRTLRLTRTVDSRTGPVCVSQPTGFFSTDCGATTAPLGFSDQLAVTRRVGGDGVVGWHVNPSVSPLASRSGPWELTCADASGRVLERRPVPVRRGGSVRVFLRCGPPSCVDGTGRPLAGGAHRADRPGAPAAAPRGPRRRGCGSCAPRAAGCGWRRGRGCARGRAAMAARGARAPTCWRCAPARAGAPRSGAARWWFAAAGWRAARASPAPTAAASCAWRGSLRPQLARSGPRARLLLRPLADVTARVRVSRGSADAGAAHAGAPGRAADPPGAATREGPARSP